MNEISEQEKTAIEIEREELNLLIQQGFRFEVSVGKRKKTFEIHEPTLSVLDRISDISLNMVIDKDKMTQENSDVMVAARKLVKENVKRQAAIIAIVVLGESYYTNIPVLKQILKVFYRIRLRKLTDFFLHTIKPSKMVEIASAVTNTSNLGDFITSMRSLSGTRTAQPRKDRIELPD
ncbi:MAG: hypothetical protein LBS07_04305 [Prevotellaceae bacterium]|jgi:hypothetical protein|nr:hypothetical protein [Prevotellaceae bacterium]